MNTTMTTTTGDTWLDIRDPDQHKLLFRYNPLLNLVEIGRRGIVHTVALDQFRSTPPPTSTPDPDH